MLGRMWVGEESFPGSRKSPCKDPEAGTYLGVCGALRRPRRLEQGK